MDPVTLILLLLIVVVVLSLFFLIRQMQQTKSELQSQVSQLQQSFSQRFDANVQNVTSHLGIITGQISNTTNVVSQVEGKLGQMQEASRRIFDLGKEIASLQTVLQSPKMRGGLGEFLLSDLLAQCLHSHSYKLQHAFARGVIVDAALFMGDRTLCVDSKFPLENFRKMLEAGSEDDRRAARKLFLSDVKKHINDIAEKYILPDENTYDFALMFIPAENVYYELIVRDEAHLYDHCIQKKVIPVSPNTFYALLQVILMGMRGLQISDHAKTILAQLQQLSNDLARLETDFTKAGNHLRDAQSSFDRSDARLQKLKKKVAELENPVPDEEPL